MSTELVEKDDLINEITDVNELISGCDSAVVSYGVDQNYNTHKVVSFFIRTSKWGHEFEDLGASHLKLLVGNPTIALVKQVDYKVKGRKVKKLSHEYYKVLVRTLIGFIIDKETNDKRNLFEREQSAKVKR